jgi:hypothetical protein
LVIVSLPISGKYFCDASGSRREPLFAALMRQLGVHPPDKETGLVCRLLEPRLLQDGFNVINKGKAIHFPSSGRQKEFERQFRSAVNLSG